MSIRSFSDRQGRTRWEVDFYPAGRHGPRIRQRLPASVRTKEAAGEWEKFGKKKERIQPDLKNQRISISSLADQYLPWYHLHRLASSYRDCELEFRLHLKPILGKLPLGILAQHHLSFYKAQRQKEKASNRTINKELAYLSGMLRWAVKEGILKAMPVRIEALPYKRPIPQVLSFQEAKDLIEATPSLYKAFLLALYTLGLRFREAQQMKWEDLDLGNQTVTVRQKGGGFKTLPLNPWLLGALDEIRPVDPRARGLVFRSRRTGKKIWDLRKAIRKARLKAGISKRVYPHLLRHSVATYLMGQGINMRLLQAFLGHKQIGTTEFYTHVSTENLRGIAAILTTQKTENQGRLLPGKSKK